MARKTTTKEPEDLGSVSVWDTTMQTVDNGLTIVSESTGFVADGFRYARELLRPELIEARVETLTTLISGVNEIVALGLDTKTANNYLRYGK